MFFSSDKKKLLSFLENGDSSYLVKYVQKRDNMHRQQFSETYHSNLERGTIYKKKFKYVFIIFPPDNNEAILISGNSEVKFGEYYF